MYVDVIGLLKEVLCSMGAESLMAPGLDAHSTIALDFEDAPTVLVDQIDGEVWLSGKLPVDDAQWVAKAPEILGCLSEQSNFIAARAPAIHKGDGTADLYALISNQFLNDAEGFLEALHGFHDRLKRLEEVLA
ncbi:MAG: hypothetical protein WDN30_14700 [Pararobbsia sp.]